PTTNFILSCIFLSTMTSTTLIHTLSLHDALPIFHPNSRKPPPNSGEREEHFGPLVVLHAGFSRPQSLPRYDELSTSWSGSDWMRDRKSTRLNSSHVSISYAVFCLKKKNKQQYNNI